MTTRFEQKIKIKDLQLQIAKLEQAKNYQEHHIEELLDLLATKCAIEHYDEALCILGYKKSDRRNLVERQIAIRRNKQ